MNSFHCSIEGKPIPQQRWRRSRNGNVFDPDKAAKDTFGEKVGMIFSAAPWSGPMQARIIFQFKRSHSNGSQYHTSKPG